MVARSLMSLLSTHQALYHCMMLRADSVSVSLHVVISRACDKLDPLAHVNTWLMNAGITHKNSNNPILSTTFPHFFIFSSTSFPFHLLFPILQPPRHLSVMASATKSTHIVNYSAYVRRITGRYTYWGRTIFGFSILVFWGAVSQNGRFPALDAHKP